MDLKKLKYLWEGRKAGKCPERWLLSAGVSSAARPSSLGKERRWEMMERDEGQRRGRERGGELN